MANLPKDLIFNGIDLDNMTIDECHIYLGTTHSYHAYHSPYLYRCVIIIQYKHKFVLDIIADSVDYVESFLNKHFNVYDSNYMFEPAKNKIIYTPVQYYKNGSIQASVNRLNQLSSVYSKYKNNKPNKIIVHCNNCNSTYEDDGFVIKNCVCKHCKKY